MDAPQALRTLVEDVARQHDADHKDMKITPFTTEGANYTTSLYLITLKSKEKPVELFAKVATINEELRKKLNADKLFITEDYVYNHLMNTYRKIQNEYKVPDEKKINFPKFYASNNEKMHEIIVLENLESRGYTTMNRKDVMTHEYATAAVEMLAKWHALSMVLEKKYPDMYKKVSDSLTFPMQEETEESKAVRAKQVASAMQVVKEEHKEKLQEFSKKFDRDMYAACYQGKRRTVLAHGCFRPSNIMHKTVNGNFDMVPVDFQMVHSGCIPSDILYLMFTGTDRDFRRKHYHQLLDHYYTYLGDMLRVYGMEVTHEYPRKDFDEDLKESAPFGMITALVILPMVTVEEKHAPSLQGDAGMAAFAIEPNQLYAERFNGIMEDYVQWGMF